jgi:hypothetical protein
MGAQSEADFVGCLGAGRVLRAENTKRTRLSQLGGCFYKTNPIVVGRRAGGRRIRKNEADLAEPRSGGISPWPE